MEKQLIIFGASGNIGQQVFELLLNNPNKWNVVAISVNNNINYLTKIIPQLPHLKMVWIGKTEVSATLHTQFPHLKFVTNNSGYDQICRKFPQATVLNAISGFAGLYPSYTALMTSNRSLLLANKESLFLGGSFLNNVMHSNNSHIIPLDSEHNAIYQCLAGHNSQMSKIFLTASGGSFRTLNLNQLKTITFEQALTHPNWNMGALITVDSSTMMNKAYEIIEAYHLFQTNQIEVLIHPQSIIHSMVEFKDGFVKAILGVPDMKTILWYGLNGCEHKSFASLPQLNFSSLTNLELQKIDEERFLAIKLAKFCLMNINHNSLTIGLNAINEYVRNCFLKQTIPFWKIMPIIDRLFKNLPLQIFETYEAIAQFHQQITDQISHLNLEEV